MCNFNLSCQVRDGSCQCTGRKSDNEIARPIPVLLAPMRSSNMLPHIYRIIFQQNEMIQSISETLKASIEKLDNFMELKGEKTVPDPLYSSEATVQDLEKMICKSQTYTHSLALVNELISPAYKERPFSVIVQFIDSSGEKAVLKESVNLKIMLFTNENPPKLVKTTNTGDNILKGTVEVQGNSLVFFRKIAVKEVTSHFRKGSFFFVVAAKDADFIKPLIIENFIVKARKIGKVPKPQKKSKTSDYSTESP